MEQEIDKEKLILPVTAALVLVIDQVTKYLVITNLLVGHPYEIVPWLTPILSITYVKNTGVAFGLFQGLGNIFIVTSVIAIAAIILYARQLPPGEWGMRLALGLALGGAIGNNLIDRVRQGFVIDFIDVNIWPFTHFPIFNAADSAISIGVAILVFIIMQEEWKNWQARRQQQAAEGG